MNDTREASVGPAPEASATAPPAAVARAVSNSRNWGMAGHLSAFTVFLGVPFPFLGPLVVWLIKRDEDAYAEWHAREALNFNLSIMLYTFISAVLILLLVGLILLPVLFVSWFVLVIVGSVKASGGEYYRYPFTLRFVS
jgi:uncharacterized Tic20 family protein